MKLELMFYGDAILRKRAKEIAEVTEEHRQLIEAMVEAMAEYRGQGLAAPQINHSIRLFIMQVPTHDEETDEWVYGPQYVCINPEVLSYSKDTDWIDEGCLSIPGIHCPVERPISIVFRATDRDGKSYEKELSGMEARTFLHELDHLNGKLIIDRAPKHVRKKIEPMLQKIKKRARDK